jgi:hypothetical protein
MGLGRVKTPGHQKRRLLQQTTAPRLPLYAVSDKFALRCNVWTFQNSEPVAITKQSDFAPAEMSPAASQTPRVSNHPESCTRKPGLVPPARLRGKTAAAIC